MRTKLNIAVILGSLLFVQAGLADTIVPLAERNAMLRRAKVWSHPTWMNENFQFAPGFDVQKGHVTDQAEVLLQHANMQCNFTPKKPSGKTPKFSCDVLVYQPNGKIAPHVMPNGKPFNVKVKFGVGNREIYGELAGTRLLWALGFGADKMFYMPQTFCYGCPANPFRAMSLAPGYNYFSPTAVEVKLDGKSIATMEVQKEQRGNYEEEVEVVREGWTLHELLSDPHIAADERVKREALLLLGAMINHTDNKSENQRLICQGSLDTAGRCQGETLAYIQDLGFTFGGGFDLGQAGSDKVNINSWRKIAVWKDPARCVAQMSYWLTQQTNGVRVTERGRQFLIKLLDGFLAGAEGQRRLIALFEAAQMRQLGQGEAVAWANAFLGKVQQLKYPQGTPNPNFRCDRP